MLESCLAGSECLQRPSDWKMHALHPVDLDVYVPPSVSIIASFQTIGSPYHPSAFLLNHRRVTPSRHHRHP